jgi:DNA polymerase III epsilon subunit-like protein
MQKNNSSTQSQFLFFSEALNQQSSPILLHGDSPPSSFSSQESTSSDSNPFSPSIVIQQQSPPRNNNKKRSREAATTPRNNKRRCTPPEENTQQIRTRLALDQIDDQYSFNTFNEHHQLENSSIPLESLYQQLEQQRSQSCKTDQTTKMRPFNTKGRVVILDIGTSGFEQSYDRLIEISAIEMIDGELTGQFFQKYLSSEVTVHSIASQIYQLDESILKLQQLLNNNKDNRLVLDQVLRFIFSSSKEQPQIVTHNASFIHTFLSKELKEYSFVEQLPALSDIFCTRNYISYIMRKKECDLLSCCNYFTIDFKVYSNLYRGAYRNALIISQIYRNILSISSTNSTNNLANKENIQLIKQSIPQRPVKKVIEQAKTGTPHKIASLEDLNDDQKRKLLRYFQVCNAQQLQSFFSKSRVPSILNMRPIQSFDDLVQKFTAIPCLGVRNLVAFYNAKLNT